MAAKQTPRQVLTSRVRGKPPEPQPPKGLAYAGPAGGLCGPKPTIPDRPLYDPKRLGGRRKT